MTDASGPGAGNAQAGDGPAAPAVPVVALAMPPVDPDGPVNAVPLPVRVPEAGPVIVTAESYGTRATSCMDNTLEMVDREQGTLRIGAGGYPSSGIYEVDRMSLAAKSVPDNVAVLRGGTSVLNVEPRVGVYQGENPAVVRRRIRLSPLVCQTYFRRIPPCTLR